VAPNRHILTRFCPPPLLVQSLASQPPPFQKEVRQFERLLRWPVDFGRPSAVGRTTRCSPRHYNPDLRLAEKRADYFAAGTLVVWDVDPLAECVHVYCASDPNQPTTYSRGQVAEAEPAVPGWRVAVDWIFA
jgi:hypothetical protein